MNLDVFFHGNLQAHAMEWLMIVFLFDMLLYVYSIWK